MEYLDHPRAYQILCMGVVVSKGKAIVTLQPRITPKDLLVFAEIYNDRFDQNNREEVRRHAIQSVKTPDGSILYGKPNWQDQQPREVASVYPDLTPRWFDIQVAVNGIGEWDYADFMAHHVNARTEYLIKQGRGDPLLGPGAIIPDTYKLHFKRHPGNVGVDFWILIQSPTPRDARILFYLLWERSIPMSDGRQKKLFVHNPRFEREIRSSADV
eukprot:4359733-Heterocapsa_arctica.AAC.1